MPLVMARYRHPLAPRLAPQPAACRRPPAVRDWWAATAPTTARPR